MIKVGPVPLDRFCARSFELQRIDKIKKDFLKGYRRNLAILGPVNIGKTSLILKYIHHVLGKDLFPIYINLEEGFLKDSFLGSLFFFLNKFSDKAFPALGNGEEVLGEKFSYFKKFVHNLEECYRNGDYGELLQDLLQLDKIIYRHLKLRCVYIIDEFFTLEDLKINSWARLLREHIMLNDNSLFILISSDVQKAKSILHSEFSLLFGNFEILELKRFSYSEAIEFLNHRGVSAASRVLDILIFLTAGYPLYLDILTGWIKDNLRALDEEGLIVAIRENILDNKGFLYRYFQEKLSSSLPYKENREYLSFVLEVAKGNIRKKELEEKLRPGLLTTSLNGHLEKSGSFYRIKDPLFRLWLLYAYQPNVMGLKLSKREELELFSRGIGNIIPRIYNPNDRREQKQVVQLVKDLLSSFSNEYVVINGRRKLLPKFTSIIEKEISPEILCLVAKKKKGAPWVVVVCFQVPDEGTAIKLNRTFLKGDYYRIFVPLKSVGVNISTILKAGGFWVWDMELLNYLLELYRPGYIVVERD